MSPTTRAPQRTERDCGRSGGEVPALRPSRNARWRALVLVLVHVVMAMHVAHWLKAGTTLSPLEPSEAMEFSKHDVINSGFVFFGLTVLSTLLLGRWFCGWACHLVALQDLCLWLLKRIGVRPKPLRSRWLALVPAVAALYMFAYPLVYRLGSGDRPGPFTVALTRDDFWSTFPPWPVALATFLVCGFAIVYFLGAKGFCTYACPYGAIFGWVERLAPGRIRVTEACEGCGHCTATCTSNVIVHEEVRRFGMVVDPGCMKCFDCVSVCPKEALYFGFGAPAVAIQKQGWSKKSLGWKRELGLAALFVAAFWTYRGLYGWIPFLFALGIAGLVAFLGAKAVELLHEREVRLPGLTLKSTGKLTGSGRTLAVLLVGILALSLHSAWIQFHAGRSARAFERWRDAREGFLTQPARALPAAERAALETARNSAAVITALALRVTVEDRLRQAWLDLFAGQEANFEREVRAAIESGGDPAGLHYDLGRFLAARGRATEALAELEASLTAQPSATVFDHLARLEFALGRNTEALSVLNRSLEAFPDHPDLLFNLGVLQGMLGHEREAREAFRRVLEISPGREDARENLTALEEKLRRSEKLEPTPATPGGPRK